MIRTIVEIDGMMCGMCEAHIQDAIRNNFKVKKVNASHSKGRAVIESADAIDEAALKSAIEATGYTVGAITAEPFEKKGLFGFGKK